MQEPRCIVLMNTSLKKLVRDEIKAKKKNKQKMKGKSCGKNTSKTVAKEYNNKGNYH